MQNPVVAHCFHCHPLDPHVYLFPGPAPAPGPITVFQPTPGQVYPTQIAVCRRQMLGDRRLGRLGQSISLDLGHYRPPFRTGQWIRVNVLVDCACGCRVQYPEQRHCSV